MTIMPLTTHTQLEVLLVAFKLQCTTQLEVLLVLKLQYTTATGARKYLLVILAVTNTLRRANLHMRKGIMGSATGSSQ